MADTTTQHPQIIEAEDDNTGDDDSILGGSLGDASYNTSVTSSIKNYTYENGRRYHAFKAGEYILPNDEQEQDRMDLGHHVYQLVLGGRLHLAPIPKNIQRVLDVGTGTGIWAIDFADQYPSAEVIGNDLSPIQPTWVPPNCRFEVDDFEAHWHYPQPFDFIHAREMEGMVRDFDELFKQAYDNLKPNGYFEIQSIEINLFSDDGTDAKAKNFRQWQQLEWEAASKFGKPMNTVNTWPDRIKKAGFQNVKREIYKLPLSPWPKDPLLKEIGRYHQLHMFQAFHAYTAAPFSRILGWSNEEIEILIAGLRNEIKDRSIHFYTRIHVIHGQKPGKAA